MIEDLVLAVYKTGFEAQRLLVVADALEDAGFQGEGLPNLMRASARLSLPPPGPVPQKNMLLERAKLWKSLMNDLKRAWWFLKANPLLDKNWGAGGPDWKTSESGRGRSFVEPTNYWLIDRSEGTPFLGVTWTYARLGKSWYLRKGNVYNVGDHFEPRGEDVHRAAPVEEVPLPALLAVISFEMVVKKWPEIELGVTHA